MSRRGVIEVPIAGKCERCGKVEKLRPYGPDNENICLKCGMKEVALREYYKP